MTRKMTAQQISARNKKKNNHKLTKKKQHEEERKYIEKPTFSAIFPTELKEQYKLEETEREKTIKKFQNIAKELNEKAKQRQSTNSTTTETISGIRTEPSTQQEEPRTLFRDNKEEG